MAAKRPIFEEVGQAGAAATAPAATGRLAAGRQGARRAVRAWLIALFVLLVALIAVGGATRLTDSGLSITEWRPVLGALPPLSDADWQAEFALYQATPEYQLQNRGMSMAEFQVIYWWEWGHRQLARFIGLVWAVGFLGFAVLRKMPPGWWPRLLLLGVLGGLQGAIGWWMVASGLVGDRVDVAPYRLAIHLGLAFLILGLIAWYVMKLSRPARDLLQARRATIGGAARWGGVLAALVFVQILLGALVAGLDAGRSYIDWPLMQGGWLPPGMWEMAPAWRNLFENPGTVQFSHRVTGYALALVALIAWAFTRGAPARAPRRAFGWVVLAVWLQAGLGIVTVINSAALPLALGHQAAAVLLLVLILRARFLALYPPAQSTIRS
ncbi:MAG TPA: heme A synthase [Rhodobacteraceae bacterium]|jgi:cytochrome c oxidase assembly protein subunit 15|nr:COX15/CtaA family protein [Paracoccaceae bacterium]HBG98567.1 heme A synthase [Paracoccaceae bacterium]